MAIVVALIPAGRLIGEVHKLVGSDALEPGQKVTMHKPFFLAEGADQAGQRFLRFVGMTEAYKVEKIHMVLDHFFIIPEVDSEILYTQYKKACAAVHSNLTLV